MGGYYGLRWKRGEGHIRRLPPAHMAPSARTSGFDNMNPLYSRPPFSLTEDMSSQPWSSRDMRTSRGLFLQRTGLSALRGTHVGVVWSESTLYICGAIFNNGETQLERFQVFASDGAMRSWV